MSKLSPEQVQACMAVASNFAQRMADHPIAPNAFYDEQQLPASKDLIRLGLYLWVVREKDHADSGVPIHWAMMLQSLRQFQPGVGPDAIGLSAVLDEYTATGIPESLDLMMEIAGRALASEDQASGFRALEQEEAARDEKFVRSAIGARWQAHLDEVALHIKRMLEPDS